MRIYEIFNTTLDRFNLKAKDIAAESGATENTLSRWRNGDKEIRDNTLEKLLEALPDDAYAFFCAQMFLQRDSPQLVVQLLNALATKVEAGEVSFKPEILEFLTKK
jgi:transcriptional regulator with XRE-family HTH domain